MKVKRIEHVGIIVKTQFGVGPTHRADLMKETFKFRPVNTLKLAFSGPK